MSRFAGFDPARPMIALPEQVFSELLDLIDDPLELRVTLTALALLAASDGPPVVTAQAVTARIAGLDDATPWLDRATERGVFVCGHRYGEARWTLAYPDARRALEADDRPALEIEASAAGQQSAVNIYRLYEDNVGVLTASVADRMKDAEAAYPEGWIVAAIEMAAVHNKRSWAYIEAILRRWHEEGRDDGESAGRADADRTAVERFGGRFAHLFKQG